eukprot:512037-Karenia_brevis.AAC.1
MARRCRYYHGDTSLSPDHFREIFQTTREFGTQFNMSILRMFLCSWTTSSRRQASDRGCIFGCAGEKDHMKHYWDCSGLLSLLATCLYGFCPDFDLRKCWGIAPVNPVQLLGAHLASVLYHKLYHSYDMSPSFSQCMRELHAIMLDDRSCEVILSSRFAQRRMPLAARAAR